MSVGPTLTIVIPVFNEEPMIAELHRRLESFLGQLGESWEVVFVDDGSHDASFSLLSELAAQEPRYKILSFSRNFGHQVAITAGLDRSEGAAVVIMDADLQDPPEVVREMLERWREGYDVVYGVRRRREGETLFKRASAAIYYRLLRSMLQFEIPVDAGDFRLVGRPVVETLKLLRERHRFVRGMVSWVGFRQTAVYYDRPARFAGETKYPLRKMIRFALDGIASFSIVPLRIATWLGVLAGLLAIVVGIWAIYQKLFGIGVVQGWTTIMFLVAMGVSAQLLMTGILGEYVGRIYEEVKRRPLYALRAQVNVRAPAAEPPTLAVPPLPPPPLPPPPVSSRAPLGRSP